MRKSTKIITTVVVAVVILAVAAIIVGPKLYASVQSSKVAAAPTITAAPEPALNESGAASTAPVTLSGTGQVAAGSQAGYRLNEVLQGENVTVRGLTDKVSGSITVADSVLNAGKISVDLASISTDSDRRDAYFRDTALQTATFPTAEFTLTKPVTLPSGTGEIELTGDLNIHGVTKSVTGKAQAAVSGDQVQIAGELPITFADYGVQAPSLGFVTVEKNGSVEFGLKFTLS